MNIAIFDFDGTLFNSPTPNRERLDKRLYGRLMAQPDQKGLGWFQTPITLSPEVTTDIGFTFNTGVAESARLTLDDPHTITVLLTGRSVAFNDRIRSLCSEEGLFFDEVILKPGSNITTGQFKTKEIERLISKYNPNTVDIWEDRDKHVSLFNDLLSRHPSIVGTVHKVSSHEPSLPPAIEDSVIEILKETHGIVLESAGRKVNYYGVLLNKESSSKLKELFADSIDPSWKITADHMTIVGGWNFSKFPEIVEYCKTHLHQDVKLTVVAVGFNDRVLAVEVKTDVPSTNPIKHITFAVATGAKPRESNDIAEWNPVVSFELSGIIEEFF